MLTKPACHRCFQRQANDALKRLQLPAQRCAQIEQQVEELLHAVPTATSAPRLASRLHALLRQQSGNSDPYREAKHEATAHALSLYPRLKTMLNSARDPLDMALRLAIAGNIIDLGVASEYDLEASIERVLHTPLAIDHGKALRAALSHADAVLYLGDNAGETVMDRLLIEQLTLPVTYVVKGGAAVNDATIEDAEQAGLHHVAEVIDNGAAALGTLLEQCSEHFRTRFDSAGLIIAKGMANYESLVGGRSGIVFLLQAKCAVVAEHLGVEEKGLVILAQGLTTDAP